MEKYRGTRTYPDVGPFSLIGIIIMGIVAGITYLLFGDTKKDRRIAEQNEHHIAGVWYRDIHDESLSVEEREYLDRRWTIVGRGFSEILYDCGGTWDNAVICEDFMKQYNIDLYSEDFDPEYVSQCVKDWKIQIIQ